MSYWKILPIFIFSLFFFQSSIGVDNRIDGNNLNIVHELYRIVFLYPNFRGSSISMNFYDFCKDRDIFDAVVTHVIQQGSVNLLTNLLINTFMNQLTITPGKNRDQLIQEQREKHFIASCFILSLENWILERMELKKFLQWLGDIIQSHNKEDKIIIYMSVINNSYEKIQQAYEEGDKKEFLDIIAEYCMFFPIIKSQNRSDDFYRVTFPGRINYSVLKQYEKQEGIGLSKPYRYAGRFVLTKIHKVSPIKNLNIIDFLNTIIIILTGDEGNTPGEEKIKENIINGNLMKHPIFLRLISMYYVYSLLDKKQDFNNTKASSLKQYAYWEICKIYASLCLREYRGQKR
jgi:hypothetical protein